MRTSQIIDAQNIPERKYIINTENEKNILKIGDPVISVGDMTVKLAGGNAGKPRPSVRGTVTLENYLQVNGFSATEFGSKIGVSQVAVWRYLNGRVPSASIMVRILNETGGKVTPNDFFLDAIAAVKRRKRKG